MVWTAPLTFQLKTTPTHTQFNTELISNPDALRRRSEFYACKVNRTTEPTLSSASTTVITWQSASLNNGALWSAGLPSRLTAQQTGVYLLTATTAWASHSSGRRGVSWRLNGSATIFDMQFTEAQISNPRQNGTELIWLTVGDYIEVMAYQGSGGNLNLLAGGDLGTNASLFLLGTPTPPADWTPPRTWTTGDILTPWLLNTEWRDNLRWLRNMKGHAGKVSLEDEVSIPDWDRTKISWTVLEQQIGNVWESGTQIKGGPAGWYMLIATLEWKTEDDGGANARRGVGYTINGRGASYDLQIQSGSQTGVITNGKALVHLQADQYVEVYAYHTADQSLTLSGDHNGTRASLHLVAAE